MKTMLVAAVLALGLALAPPVAGQDEGGKRPRIKILGVPGKLNFEIRPRESCDFFAIETIRIRFRGHGFNKTFRLEDPCGDWIGGRSSSPNVRYSREDGSADTAARLKLRAVGKREVERRYRFDVRIGDRTESKGIMRVTIRKGDDGGWERYLYLDD